MESSSIAQLKQVFLYLFPQNKRELILFLSLLVFYYSIALIFQLNTSIVDYPYFIVDLIFSFDNINMFHFGTPNIDVHPFLKYIMMPIQFIGIIAHKFFGYKAIGVVITLFFASFISLSVVYVYRYIQKIVELDGKMLWLLTIMYVFFFTNLILCFATESYSFSMWLVPFSILFFSLYIKNKATIKPLTLGVFTFLLGGITVSNGLKPLIGYLSSKGKLFKQLTICFIIGILFLISVVATLTYTSDKSFVEHFNFRLSFTYDSSNQLTKLNTSDISESFFYSPILSPSVIETHYNSGRFALVSTSSENNRLVILHDFYKDVWQYLWMGAMLLVFATSIIKCRKNIFVQMMLAMWSIDLAIYFIIGYGIGEGFIYGGHWIFIVPMILAWGYKSLSRKWQPIAFGILSVLCTTMVINNLYQLYSTYQLGVKLFPPIIP